MQIAIIDGYLDEPSCLGVPPYISPHVRYVYGALLDAGADEEQVEYILIDQLRTKQDHYLAKLEMCDWVIIIAGTTVPGRYLGGKPISVTEIAQFANSLQRPRIILGGPLLSAITDHSRFGPGVHYFCGEIAAHSIYCRLTGRMDSINQEQLITLLNRWAVLGAALTRKHRDFPFVVCELETFRGCPRSTNCSFCSERLKQITYCRDPEAVKAEVAALYSYGNRYFRLGCQTDLAAYGGQLVGNVIQPRLDFIRRLYQGIAEAAPGRRVLHMDNINPATLARYPEIAEQLLSIITTYNTPGDVAAFGLESADPKVLERNNINTNTEEVLTAVSLMNRIGGKREEGVPKLLPGINLLHGLQGETAQTYELNYQFLKSILDQGLLLRRINIRQVLEISGYRSQKINKYRFQVYKEKINTEINQPMLRRVFAAGTILRNVLTEKHEGSTTFGRQLGSYPILVGIPGKHPLRQLLDVIVVDHGFRSVTALPYPFFINHAGISELQALPDMGKKRAMRIFLAKPIKNFYHLAEVLDGSYDVNKLKGWIDFGI